MAHYPRIYIQFLSNTNPATDSLLQKSFLTNPVEASINAFLIDTGDRQSASGYRSRKLLGPSGKLQASLKTAGYTLAKSMQSSPDPYPCSGGLVEAGQLFHTATIYVGKPDVDFGDRANAKRSHIAEKYFDEAKPSNPIWMG